MSNPRICQKWMVKTMPQLLLGVPLDSIVAKQEAVVSWYSWLMRDTHSSSVCPPKPWLCLQPQHQRRIDIDCFSYRPIAVPKNMLMDSLWSFVSWQLLQLSPRETMIDDLSSFEVLASLSSEAEMRNPWLDLPQASVGFYGFHFWRLNKSITGWWLTYPSEKWWSSSVGIILPNIWKNRNVPNHQPNK